MAPAFIGRLFFSFSSPHSWCALGLLSSSLAGCSDGGTTTPVDTPTDQAGTGGSAPAGPVDATGGTDSGDPTTEPDAPGEVSGDFELIFYDEFDTLDTTRWGKASHTFAENGAQFTPEMAFVEDGQLVLRMMPNPTPGAEKAYISGELRTLEHYSYGRFEVRAKFAAGSGLVGSLFTYYDHWADPGKPEDWNELDIEFLGGSVNQIQFNVIHWDATDSRTTHEKHVDLDWSPSEDFHDYAIEWLPTVVNFYVDGELLHSQTDQIAEFVNLDQRMMMNLWPVIDRADLNSWAGQFDDAVLPVESRYEWAKLYQYTGQ